MKFSVKMYRHNLENPVEYQGHRSEVKVTWFFCVFVVCMIRVLEPFGLDSRNVIR